MNIRSIIAENKLADFGKIEPNEGAQEKPEKPIESLDEPLVHPQTEVDSDDIDADELQISKPRFKKRKLLIIILVLAGILAGVYYAIPVLMPKEDSDSTTEATIEAPPSPPSFIDAAESENKALKEDAEAKKKHVNVFEFDINNCLQTYSDEECMNLFDKNLQISE